MRHATRNAADTALATAARLWFLVAVIGQSLLAIYVISFYGRAVLPGRAPNKLDISLRTNGQALA